MAWFRRRGQRTPNFWLVTADETVDAAIPAEIHRLFEFGFAPITILANDEHKFYCTYAGIELRFLRNIDGDWVFDEVVGKVFLHIEQMDPTNYWMGISPLDQPEGGHMMHVHIGSATGRAAVNMRGWGE